MYRCVIIFIVSGLCLIAPNVMAAEKNQDYQLFTGIFSKWTDAFNHKDLTGSCDLFSRNVLASYQGVPPKDYTAVCDGFKKTFHEKRDYKYNFKLQQIYRSNDLAVVRVTWYLQISAKNKLISATKDEGLDVFQQDSEGHWKIINYLAYPEKP